jgi:hypothetical protein
MDFEAGRNRWPSIADEPEDTVASYLTVPTHKTTVVVEVVSPSPLSGLLN